MNAGGAFSGGNGVALMFFKVRSQAIICKWVLMSTVLRLYFDVPSPRLL